MTPKKSYVLGTRRSLLARVQSEFIQNSLSALGLNVELKLTESEGDRDLRSPLYEIETSAPGLFTKGLEQALLRKEIDLAVHSLKDLPTTQPPELVVGAVPKRESAGDCLIIHPDALDPAAPLFLKPGTVIGTSSLRRDAQIFSVRSDLITAPIRGNVPTRLKQVEEKKFGATLLAQAGLNRLGLDLGKLVKRDLPLSEFVPAPGQGALAVEIRTDADSRLKEALAQIHDPITDRATHIERAVLKGMFGGCTLPLGVYVETVGNILKLKSFLGESEGERTEKNRKWISFHRFDFSSGDDETLVGKTIQHFKEVSRAAPHRLG